MNTDILIVVAALDEADHISSTLAALAVAFPGAPVWVADDGSTDATPELARAAGATVVRSPRVIGKGQAMTAGVQAALSSAGLPARDHGGDPKRSPSELGEPSVAEPIVVLCDGDLGESAASLGPLTDAVRRGDADLAVAAFVTRAGGGFGLAVGFARWAIRRRCGLSTRAPIAGQRALGARVLPDVLPFAPGFGMEVGMTIDAVRAGRRVVEVELDLAHRVTGRTVAGFLHRARQLVDFVRVYLCRGRASAY
jgi:glycosyltransferase involved in cell wall biosynthesis